MSSTRKPPRAKTDSRVEQDRRRDPSLKCSFCGKLWHEVAQIITPKEDGVGICDECVRKFSAAIENEDREAR